MSIATKAGDNGQTGLIGGTRVSKGATRLEAYGTIDELIAQIGLARALCRHNEASARGKQVQRDLFAVAESLAKEDQPPLELDAARVDEITNRIYELEELDGILIDWAIVGDDAAVAAFDVARTVCRRAERAAVRLHDAGEPVAPSVLAYLNRLSDFLWLLGRLVERDAGISASLRKPDDVGKPWSKAWP